MHLIVIVSIQIEIIPAQISIFYISNEEKGDISVFQDNTMSCHHHQITPQSVMAVKYGMMLRGHLSCDPVVYPVRLIGSMQS